MKTLYLSDLDGTLLRSDERLSPFTAETVNRFIQSGGFFSYATARSLVTASKVTAGLHAAFPVITYNGAFVVDGKTGVPLWTNFFSKDEALFIKSILTGCGVYPVVYAYIGGRERFSFIESRATAAQRHFLDSRANDVRRRSVKDFGVLFDGTPFIAACMDTEKTLSPVRAAFENDRRFYCIYQKDYYSGAQWCEILPAAATKANAALRLKAHLGCGRLVVFGDGRNDLPLFEIADEAYATAGAVPELKAKATAVIGSNDDDGVAKWLIKNAVCKTV